MVSSETLMNFHDVKILFTACTNDSDKQLGSVVIQNNKPIALLLSILNNPQNKYDMTDKELLLRLEILKQL